MPRWRGRGNVRGNCRGNARSNNNSSIRSNSRGNSMGIGRSNPGLSARGYNPSPLRHSEVPPLYVTNITSPDGTFTQYHYAPPVVTAETDSSDTASSDTVVPDQEFRKSPDTSDMETQVLLTASLTEDVPASPPSEPNISKREYIYFLPYPLPPDTPVPYSTGLPEKNPLRLHPHQFEPTDTLVLTSPNKTFVDIRLWKSLDGYYGSVPNHGQPQGLQWAFSGTSSSEPISKPDWHNVTHAIWTHWVDSRHPIQPNQPAIPIDEGDMYPLAKNLTLEHGHAFHPDLNAVKSHEEMWRDLNIQSTNDRGTKVCAVLRLHNEALRVRGVIIRVGQYCQGMVMQEQHVATERWEFDPKKVNDEEKQGWTRVARTGQMFLPCPVLFQTEILAVGGEIQFMNNEWTVEEVWEWV